MAISNKQLTSIGIFGAIAGFLSPILMKWVVMPVLNFLGGVVPAFSAKLANPGTISISVRESLVGLDAGLSGWIIDSLGLTGLAAKIPFSTYITSALGFAVLFIVGAYVADALGMLKGKPKAKSTAVIFTGSVIAGFILGGFAVPQIGLDMVNALLAMLVNATVISYAVVPAVKYVNKDWVPF